LSSYWPPWQPQISLVIVPLYKRTTNQTSNYRDRAEHKHMHAPARWSIAHHCPTLLEVWFRVIDLTTRHTKCDAIFPTKGRAGSPLFPQAAYDTPPFGSFDRPLTEVPCL
jgi:hypothetical protein